jgi:S1-C subfamily serine protease
VRRSFILPLLLAACSARAANTAPEKSVIQVYNFSQGAVWDAPWRFEPVRRSSGTGFLIKGKRIVTNAHVVSWAKQIIVRRYQDPRPYRARVAFVGHDCDLAVLEVDDPGFYDGLEPLTIGEMPKVRSTVVTYGYPAGGEQISYTRGVVSRIEMQNYVHIGNRSFLGVQTDAAINPGNSGGPVIQDDLVVGVAFQGMPGLENTGFFIPPPVIQHFLKDIEDGKYDGFPLAGIRVTALQAPAHRRALGLDENGGGARVDAILPMAAAKGVLQEDDVILKVGSYDVGSDATILYDGNRVHMTAAMQGVQAGEKVEMTIWRAGARQVVRVPLTTNDLEKAVSNQYDVPPRYFVYGGLVFTALSLDYVKTFGRNWSDSANAELVYELYYRRTEHPEVDRPEPVVLATTLSHPVNANMKVQGRSLVNRINGRFIGKLEDVVAAFASGTNAEHVIEFLPNNGIECLSKAEADRANPEILKTYGISKDRRL